MKSLLLLATTFVSLICGAAFYTLPATAADPTCPAGQKYNKSLNLCETPISPGNLPKSNANKSQIENVIGIVITIIGAIAFLMVVLSGFRYVLAGGEPEKLAKARNALIFALVGLLIAITAQAIVSFVVKNI